MVVKQLAFVGLWQSLFLLVLGWQVTRTAIFPLAYLILAVPFGYSVIPTLQDATAQMVVQLLRLTGMPVFLDGYYIQIPSGAFLVAEACSGVRYLMVSIALGILAANLFFQSWWRRLLFIGLSLVVPVLANGMRAYGIVMLAHLSDYQLAVDVDHVFYGFIFLAMVTLTLLGLAALLRDRHDTLRVDSPEPAPAAGTAVGRRPLVLGLPGQALFGGMAIGMVVLAQVWTATAKAPPENHAVTLRAPSAEPAWATAAFDAPAWSPQFRGSDAILQQGYRQGDSQIDLFIAYYAFQREGAEAISDANSLISERSDWKKTRFNQSEIDFSGRPFLINRLVAQSRDETYIVWYWYWVGGENTNSRFAGKLLEMKAIATDGERAAAVVAISSKVSEDAAATEALLESFLRQSIGRNGSLVQLEGSPAAAEADLPTASSEMEGETPKP
jgi:EpsI family protein